MLLNANVWVNENGEIEHRDGCVFELTSGKYQTEFITLWELFDEREAFKECMYMFSMKARYIRSIRPYTSIVTCTETAKHILDHVHASIETDDEKINIHYLGHYPFLNVENRNLLSFKDEEVLIITDVVASGTLVKTLADLVAKGGGIPVAVLCVVLTQEELILKLEEETAPIIEYGRDGDMIRVHSLTDRLCKMVASDIPQDKIRKIDPVTVLPEQKHAVPKSPEQKHAPLDSLTPLFDAEESFAHFEKSNALNFGFFKMGRRRFTTAIHFERLFEYYGDTIWEAMKNWIPDDALIATTFSREDIRLKEFVEDRIGEGKKYVFIPRRDSIEAYNSYFVLAQAAQEIKNRHVVLLLSTVHTSEKLRNLSSLLATHSVTRITVICLLNRMGVHTDDFVSRVKRLLRGVGGQHTDDTHFKFISVYSITDFRSDDILMMQQMIESLFSYYQNETRVPSFRRKMVQERNLFSSKSLTARTFETNHTRRHASLFDLNGNTIPVNSREGKLFLLCTNLIATRDYRPLIAELQNLGEKEVLFKIFAILIADLNYLKLSGAFTLLRKTLIDTIRRYRTDRFEVEGQGMTDRINSLIERELNLALGLALLAYLDQDYDYDPFIIETLTCGLDASEWIRSPENLLAHFGDERTAWRTSLLMHFAHYNFRQPSTAKELKNEIQELVEHYMDYFQENMPEDDSQASAEKQKVKISLSFILTEIGVHEYRQRHNTIRHLQSNIIYVKKGHSSINSSLESATHALASAVDSGLKTVATPTSRHRRFQIQSPELLSKIEDALYSVGVLEDIASAIRHMFEFAQARPADVKRYITRPDDPGFAADIFKLGDLFQRIQDKQTVSQTELEIITGVKGRIGQDLWDNTSHLRHVLVRYIVPFRDLIVEKMRWANNQLKLYDRKYGEVWSQQIDAFSTHDEDVYVLVDPFLLSEVVKNIFYNVRHSVFRYGRNTATYPELVDVQLRPEAGEGEEEYWKLTVITKGHPLKISKQGTTLEQQNLELVRYGGSLSIRSLESKQGNFSETGTIVDLRLIKRRKPPVETTRRKEAQNEGTWLG